MKKKNPNIIGVIQIGTAGLWYSESKVDKM